MIKLLLCCLCQWLVLWSSGASAQNAACKRKWFGNKCQFPCRCNTTFCSISAGLCNLDNLCRSSYFGPSCQYLNVASMVQGNPGFLTDHDDTTCNPDRHATTLFFDLKSEIRFFWLRLNIRRFETAKDIELRLNDQPNSCPNQKIMYHIDHMRDVMCDTHVMVMNLTIKGSLVPSICSLEIGAGINAVLLQPTKQSSTEHPENLNKAEFAADGDTSSYACIKTRRDPGGAVWSVTFPYPYVLYKARLYNNPNFQTGLAGFKLMLYNEDMHLLEIYESPANYSDQSIDITLHTHQPTKILQVRAGRASGNMLTLCEVQAFGVQVCPEGFYGISCDEVCSCNPYENCDAITGGCTKACPDGLYGFQCGAPCPRNCRTARCNPRTGTCRRCADGYIGDTCKKSCPSGTHGTNCTKPCPTICEGDLCDPVSGDCFKCKDELLPPKCQEMPECRQGFYGMNCSQPCSDRCKDGLCNNSTGRCFECKPHFEGEDCVEVYQPPWLYIIAGIVCFLLLLLCIVLMLRKPSPKPQAEEEHKPPPVTPIDNEVTDVSQTESIYQTESEASTKV